MTQYLLSVHMVDGEESPAPEVMEKTYRDVDVFNKKLQDQGSWVFAGGLHPASTATVVRVDDGEVVTTDGPFAEAKEQLAGFYLVECASIERATEIARQIPEAEAGVVEVRPVRTFSGLEM